MINNYYRKIIEVYQAIFSAANRKKMWNNFRTPEEAQVYLENWIKDAASSTVETFKIIAVSFKDKLQYIINWFRNKISSVISEGINNKIKRLKRMAYEYRDIEYFKLQIHQHCGLLNPRRYLH